MIELFSPLECDVIRFVKMNTSEMNITELAEMIYRGCDKPVSPGSVVASTITRINQKCNKHNLNWTIEGEGLGRSGKIVKIKKRSIK
jgi:hypothetical protein